VLAVAGRIEHEAVLRAVGEWFDGSVEAPARVPAPPVLERPAPADSAEVRVAFRRLAQGNLCIGLPGVSRSDPDRWALDLLGAVLGDGMSSRLFLELRERRSLTYDVSTFGATYVDCGVFGVHAGFDPDQADRVVSAVVEQLERVVQEPISTAELERARAYTRGRLELRMEETGSVASWLGSGESLLPRILTVGGDRWLEAHRRRPLAVAYASSALIGCWPCSARSARAGASSACLAPDERP
jgi:predicted Zn-dependent peptidase